VVLLAMSYAQAIDDDPALLPEMGPKLLAALVQLGLTPAARGKGGAPGVQRTAAGEAYDELKARRRQRAAG
jgi:hypothetical protein